MKIATPFRSLHILLFLAGFIFCSDLHAQPAGGKWFAAQQLPILTNARLVFADSMVGYYIGQDTGYVTTNGAATWKQLSFPPEATPTPSFLFAPSHNTVIAFQQRRIDGTDIPGVMISNDMGSTWTVVSSNPLPNKVKALTMWTVNDGFRIWLDDATTKDYCAVTHDGGKTYGDFRGDATLEKYISKLNGSGALNIQSDWSDSLHGVIVVSGTGAQPVLLTSDGGRSWKETYPKYKGDSTIKLSYGYLYPGSNSVWAVPAIAVQARYFYYSSDFGDHWQTTDTIPKPKTAQYPPIAVMLAPVSSSAAWTVVASDDDHPLTSRNVVAYKDFSGSWIPSFSLPSGFGKNAYFLINDIQFSDPNHGWISLYKYVFVPSLNDFDRNDSAYFFRFAASPSNDVPEPISKQTLRPVPNPASSTLRIEGIAGDERIGKVSIMNTLGLSFAPLMTNNTAGFELDVSSLSNGCYYISILTSRRKESVPVMIVH